MRTFVRRASALALTTLAAVAIAGPVSACDSPNPSMATQVTKASENPTQTASRETVSYAFWINATDSGAPYSDTTIQGLMNATNADYEADSPYCQVVELTPDVDAYACIGVPLAEAGPYADDSSYDVHFTDDGELVTSTNPTQVLDMWRWTTS